MNDDKLVRLENFRRFCQSRGLTPTELAANPKLGGRYTYWRDLLAGNKSFGEKAARKIEAAYDLPRFSLDDAPKPPSAQESQAEYAKGAMDALYVLQHGTPAQREELANRLRLYEIHHRHQAMPDEFERRMGSIDRLDKTQPKGH